MKDANLVTSQNSEHITCDDCGNSGELFWLTLGPLGTRPEFGGISGRFYERISRKPPYPIELICNCCGKAVQNSAQWDARGQYVEYQKFSREAETSSRSARSEVMRALWLELAAKYAELSEFFAERSRVGKSGVDNRASTAN